jgi:hypothetical protein
MRVSLTRGSARSPNQLGVLTEGPRLVSGGLQRVKSLVSAVPMCVIACRAMPPTCVFTGDRESAVASSVGWCERVRLQSGCA